MPSEAKKLSPFRIVLAVLALAVILLSWWQVASAGRGLVSRSLVINGQHLRYLAVEGQTGLPGVVIAHGFSGSKELMLGFGYTMARAGYGAMLFDFAGHGSSSGVLDREGGTLSRDVQAAYEALVAQPEVDPGRIALIGHSMGSGAVMSAGIERGDQYSATVAVSPTGADVSPALPRNLFLMAGTLEPSFLSNAQDLLAAAGGPNDDLAAGKARGLLAVPNVEHITILFSPMARQAALDWINATFGLPAVAAAADTRMPWYLAQLAGWLLLLTAVAPLFPKAEPLSGARRRPWHWLALLLAPFAASLLLAGLGRLADISAVGGMLVAGTLAIWFVIFGLLWLLPGFRVPRPSGDDIAWGLVLFALLWVAFGLMAQFVWLPWMLNAERLVRWPFMAAAVLPWLLASGLVQHRARPAARLGWWALQSAVIVAGLGLAVALVPGLFFIVLLMPVIPIVLGVMAVAGAAIDRPWSYALGNALFFGWLIVSLFPLA